MMYGKHSDRGMIKIDSRNVNLLEEEFPTIGEVKRNIELYELQDLEDNARIPSMGEVSQPNLEIDENKESGPIISKSDLLNDVSQDLEL
ncbi:hypothetical protein ACS0TY_023861 [Phlomoides rotata]